MTAKSNFLYPHYSFHGEVKPENVLFDANLQEFARRASYICNLETNGKVSAEKAYREIKKLWKELKNSKRQLQIGENPFQSDT
ncbi:MAG: hypothetical protein WBA07_23010 [Rivularia sp. (in: cyanobacteria)]